MHGTNQIVFMLFIGYIVFTTMKGNLRKWLQVVGLREETTRETILSGDVLRGQR